MINKLQSFGSSARTAQLNRYGAAASHGKRFLALCKMIFKKQDSRMSYRRAGSAMSPTPFFPIKALLVAFLMTIVFFSNKTNASVLADFPLECQVMESADYSTTKTAREMLLLIERANSESIFSYPKDVTDKRFGGIIFPHLGYFVKLKDSRDLLRATDSMTQRDQLRLRREPGGVLSYKLQVGSNIAGGSLQGTCRRTQIEVSRFPFRDSPWPAEDYAEVRLYQYNAASQTGAPIYSKGGFSDSIVKSVKLNDDQIRRLVAATTGKHPDHPIAACFVPRHAFAFLDAKGNPISYAEVCFECSNYRVSNSEGGRFDLDALARLVQEAGMSLR